ncbi:MAG: TonB-dependent receptor plug [Gemmatimonadetes bacterium]|nr:TonB-dependent receptor plug [Gemmatimonadota bacterium]
MIPHMRAKLLAFVFLAACAAAELQAQGGAGRIRGVVFDSIARRPLAGASVMVVQLSATPQEVRVAITDPEGRFRLDGLPAGRFGIGFTTELLDSLELTLPQREIVLPEDGLVRVELATPSRERLFAAVCPGVAPGPGRGVLFGTVRNADTDEPLPLAELALRWSDLVLDRAAVRATNVTREASVRTDSLGVYRICGIPTGTYLILQVQRAGRAGTAVRTLVGEGAGIAKQNLSFSSASARAFTSGEGAVDREETPLGGTAALDGTVRDRAGRGVADALVRVAGTLSSARTDTTGRFALSGLPAGTQLLEVRRIGYLLGQHPVELRSDRLVTQDLALLKVETLDSILVLAQRVRYREFEGRAGLRAGVGTFYRARDLEKLGPTETADILRRVTGFSVVGSGLGARLRSTRGAVSLLRDCEPNVVIDNMQHQEINLVLPADIAGLEIYRGPAGAPPEYDATCGVVVIWTKR